ncbi:MAG: 50S ribosomal protein L1 [Chloroflexi bacterium]|nr:50S ribosomal protein L1 [Chloroflexota bacterium]MDA1146815.1 50S ribosomal protein L1 [Chloroflexota bacterium]MQC82429.1 50S ribosomal protein L1 [Chloroflexota bacterium]
MPKLGKRTVAARANVEERLYEPLAAVELVKQNATAKFDETVELHLRTGLDGRHADQQIRGSVVLPNGIGREVRVLVFAEGEAATLAMEAGADEVGGDDLIARVADGYLAFDVALAQREMMGKVGSLGRVLGPRGLMPNPRNSTVLSSQDLARGVQEAKAGRVDFRLDRMNLLHCTIGKASFTPEQLEGNLRAMVSEIVRSKPTGTKGAFLRAATLTSTMGPGVPMDVNQMMAMATATGS